MITNPNPISSERADQISQFIVDDILNIARRLTGRRAIQVNLGYSKFGDLTVHLQIKRGSPPMSAPSWERQNFEKYGFSVDANTYVPKKGSPGIDLQITVNPLSESDSLIDLEHFLLDTIRHEIEHIQTVDRRNPALRKTHQSSYKYFLLNDEIPAAVAGLKLLAKKRGTTLSTEIENYLMPFVKSGFMSDSELAKVKDAWLKHSF
jgi:hypothetical protein